MSNYFLFNLLSRKIYSTQLILPPKYARYDSQEGRDSNLIDYLALFSGIIVMIISGLI